jgi:hypothetical protein
METGEFYHEGMLALQEAADGVAWRSFSLPRPGVTNSPQMMLHKSERQAFSSSRRQIAISRTAASRGGAEG